MATESPLGTKIKKRRQVLGMTQQAFAGEVGVSKSTVANWESGKHFPLRYLGKVEAVLGIALTDAEPARPVVSDRLLADLRRELGDDRAALVVAALEEFSADPRVGPAERGWAGRRVEGPAEGPDKQGDIFFPGGDPRTEDRPRDPDAGDDDQVGYAETRS